MKTHSNAFRTWKLELTSRNKQTNKQAKNRRILDKFVMFSLSKPSRLSTRYHKPLVYTYKVVLIELLYYYSISALMPGGLLQKIDRSYWLLSGELPKEKGNKYKEQLDAHLLNEITCTRDWPLEKLWQRVGGFWGIFQPQEFFFVIKFLVWIFFRP